MRYNSVYINEVSGNWILHILGDDIFRELQGLGYICRKGPFEEYKGEDIGFHMWWRHAQPYKEAKINAVFVTHVDDSIKEHDLVQMKDNFDYFFCMSPEDAHFLVELGFEENRVFGLNLPVRNSYIRPLSVGIFSNSYLSKGMNTKNELWLIDFCKNHPHSNLINFVFIGHGWESTAKELEKYHCSFEWHCVDRSMPYEYFFQQLKLETLDYYLYMGMDGGAMGAYDAYAMGTSLCISDDGYHKCIPDVSMLFSTQEQFIEQLSAIIEKQKRKLDFFASHTPAEYVKKVAFVFENGTLPENVVDVFDYSVKEKRRENYYSWTFRRLRQPIVSMWIKWKNRNKFKCQRQ